jgi:hypothetical protein
MSAELQLMSLYGNGSSITLPDTAKATIRLFLTDLPQPSSYELYMDGKLVQATKWNSGIGYEENIPVNSLADGTYTFQAKIYFPTEPPVTTNTGTLTVTDPTTFTQVASSAGMSVKPAPSLNLPEEVAIAIGSIATIGLAVYLVAGKYMR